MNWKKTGIKVVMAFVIATLLTKVGLAFDAGLTNELAIQQMQNTSTTLLTSQGFNKIMILMDTIMVVTLGFMFSPELKYLYKQLKGEKKDDKKI